MCAPSGANGVRAVPGQSDDGGTVCRMDKWEGETALSDLFQHGTKYAKLSFCEGTVHSVCVGKMSHDAFDPERTAYETVVEERKQLFRRESQATHSCFHFEVD